MCVCVRACVHRGLSCLRLGTGQKKEGKIESIACVHLTSSMPRVLRRKKKCGTTRMAPIHEKAARKKFHEAIWKRAEM